MIFGVIPSDWLYGLLGGLMIGTAGAILLLVNGRIMGISGIFGSIVDRTAGAKLAENAALVAGLVAFPAIFAATGAAPATGITGNWLVIVLGGLLVGVGTRMANGCTSGHGVCGISRFSPRGIVATLVYIGAGAVALYLTRHVMGVV
ncbi:YeeE/YedE family protein [Rhodobacteraceae bacterium D3-12]|nr:YeeE/YedE family protein [Rhodobacteraceae bacterium D3-12]